jgi:DNA-directed RNA polymerase beta subunit
LHRCSFVDLLLTRRRQPRIDWIEHDAQAVPLLRPESPRGYRPGRRAAADSMILVKAEFDGVVDYVDANKIIVRYDISETTVLSASSEWLPTNFPNQ